MTSKFLYPALFLAAFATGTCDLKAQGLHGYIACDLSKPPEGYTAGIGFYSSVWPLIGKAIDSFQIGLPSTWIIPDNSDNKTTPLCPPGTLARQWPERGPTWGSVFQTIEGGLGYWAGNHFHYGPPKFSMNGTPSCYDLEIATPGWSFFYSDSTIPENMLGIAQLSNRLLLPPDGLPFKGNPNGEVMGYSYMALPFSDPRPGKPSTGDQNWTLFLNAENFKGAVAYYVAETWSKIARGYLFNDGRGLDTRPGVAGGGAIEINTVPHFVATDARNQVYSKIPQLQFPVDSTGKTVLVQNILFYSRDAIYHKFKQWRNGGGQFNGSFDLKGATAPSITTRSINYRQDGKKLTGIDDILTPTIFDSTVFGLQWSRNIKDSMALFPQYFKEVNGERFPVEEKDVPAETKLAQMEFPEAKTGAPYSSPEKGAWKSPGPTKGPYKIKLADGSTVTYYWYRFIDQPVFQQYNWTTQEKQKLQAFVEKIHRFWKTDMSYMPPPSSGKLATLDPALLVVPPKGLELGYVPIVTRQEMIVR